VVEVSERKSLLRRAVLDRRQALDAYDLAVAARDLRDVLLATPEVLTARCVAAYVSVGREPGTGPLLEALRKRGVLVLLPVLLADGDLDWVAYEGPHALAPVARGLLEPVGDALGVEAVLEADVVLVPGVAVDPSGMRLGRGGGSYDRVLTRVLARRARPPLTCVLLHDGEVVDTALPREPHDAQVAAVATPSGLQRF